MSEIRKTNVKNQTLEHKQDNQEPRAVKGNVMQREKHVPPMTGRNKSGTPMGEHGKSWSDHFGEAKKHK